MKRILAAVVLSMMAWPFPALATGLVLRYEVKTEASGPCGQMTSYTETTMVSKGHMLRVDTRMPAIPDMFPTVPTVIYDSGEVTMTTVDHLSKTYRIISKEELETSADFFRSVAKTMGAPHDGRPKLEPTGATLWIGEYETAEYRAITPTGKIHLWIADSPELQEAKKALTPVSSMGFSFLGGGYFPDPASFVGFPAGFPIRTAIETLIGGVNFVMTMELVSLEAQEINETEFSPPKGYTEGPRPGWLPNGER